MEELIRIGYNLKKDKLLQMAEIINSEIDENMLEVYDLLYAYNEKKELVAIEFYTENKNEILNVLDAYFKKAPAFKEINPEDEFLSDFVFYDGESLLEVVPPCHLDLDGFEFYEE